MQRATASFSVYSRFAVSFEWLLAALSGSSVATSGASGFAPEADLRQHDQGSAKSVRV
jgi:hypothetical protein